MKIRFTLALLFCFTAGLFIAPAANADKPKPKPGTAKVGATVKSTVKATVKTTVQKKNAGEKPKIQMAILLDTSNSMDGLINQCRAQLWKIVNEFAKARKNGQQPDLEVALFEYGNNSIDASAGYVRMVLPLTDDLDKVSDELFSLKTNGGKEYCGQVIELATARLKWSDSDQAFKCIFVAGNEAFTQGNVDAYKACSATIKKGITVSTIFCGPFARGVSTGWQKGAQLADGNYIAIDQNQQVAAIKTPVDVKLIKLGEALNKTYVFFGDANVRKDREELQKRQDKLAAKQAPAAAASRAVTKGGGLYNNARFDLVDALEKKSVKLEDLKDDQLCEALKGKSLKEKKAYIEAKAKQRKEIQDQIKKVNSQREKYIAAERAKNKDKKTETLDSAVIKAVREQAAKKAFKFEK